MDAPSRAGVARTLDTRPTGLIPTPWRALNRPALTFREPSRLRIVSILRIVTRLPLSRLCLEVLPSTAWYQRPREFPASRSVARPCPNTIWTDGQTSLFRKETGTKELFIPVVLESADQVDRFQYHRDEKLFSPSLFPKETSLTVCPYCVGARSGDTPGCGELSRSLVPSCGR